MLALEAPVHPPTHSIRPINFSTPTSSAVAKAMSVRKRGGIEVPPGRDSPSSNFW